MNLAHAGLGSGVWEGFEVGDDWDRKGSGWPGWFLSSSSSSISVISFALLKLKLSLPSVCCPIFSFRRLVWILPVPSLTVLTYSEMIHNTRRKNFKKRSLSAHLPAEERSETRGLQDQVSKQSGLGPLQISNQSD